MVAAKANGASRHAQEKEEQPIKVYELRLEEDGSPHRDKTYVRLPAPLAPYVLRFTLDAGSAPTKEGVLWTSMPPKGKPFERTKFWDHPLNGDCSKPTEVDLEVHTSGAFEFYVEYLAANERIPYPTKEQPIFVPDAKQRKRVQSRHGFFNVDPILRAPRRSAILDEELRPLPVGQGGVLARGEGALRPLSQDGVVLLSFISKWAGTLSEWRPHLDVARDCGYNMIHYPPLQVRGSSNSPYSIADQLDFSRDLFEESKGKAAAGVGPAETREERFETVARWMGRIRDEWGMLAMVDVVLNHTANNSEWLYEHPDSAYNPSNSPHLTPAAELDLALHEFSARLGELQLPVDPTTPSDVEAIMGGVRKHVLEELKLWQYYVVDVRASKESFSKALHGGSDAKLDGKALPKEALVGKSLQDAHEVLAEHALRNRLALSGRFATHIDVPIAVAVMRELGEGASEQRIEEVFSDALDKINAPLYALYDGDLEAIVSNLSGRLSYMRLEPNGPKLGPISESSPLCETYFTRLDPKHPAAKAHDASKLVLANNGWTWGQDPLRNFAESDSRVYLRRELIAWGDCVKLRYGQKPQDSPYLWRRMEEYCTSLARIFDGFRIDNCHSTPLHVGEHMLDAARRVNPNLYVCAELFTGNAETDTLFVCRLGLNSLFREMDNAHDAKEESRLLYRFGVNKPIGSMDEACLARPGSTKPTDGAKEGVGSGGAATVVVPLRGSSPHALFMDLTHDNETPTAKRTTEDALTMGSLVTFSWSAVGSTKGFDDLYPKLLNVVSERRRYGVVGVAGSDEGRGEGGKVGGSASGIREVKRLLNHLHTEMVEQGYSEGHSHQEGDYIMMHRTHPQTHKGYLLVAHTAFTQRGEERGQINPIKLNRTKVKYIYGKTLRITSREAPQDDEVLLGFPSELVDVPTPPINEGQDDDGHFSEIVVPDHFPPASVMLFATWMDELGAELDEMCARGTAEEAMAQLDLVDLNVVLYRADGEERDVTEGRDGVYTLPDYGSLTYCGLEGWMAPLREVVRTNDLGHALCANLRQGTWALDYVAGRLERQSSTFPRLAVPAAWLRERVDAIKARVSSFMRPKYFALLVTEAYRAARSRALSQMSKFVREGSDFTQSLALVAVQMNGQVASASLWHDRPSASMAAGLPFFSAGWARLWGRDVFISLRGLYLTTGMGKYAREHILSFGSTLRYGLIPNLLNSTANPRYNCRDGPWFFAQNVQDYTRMVEGGEAILTERVKRRFPRSEKWVEVDSPEAFSYESTVAEIVQEILQRHAEGIHFREHNAGPNVDEHMRDEGFNIDVEVDWATGIVFGGNEFNCGTWQDKNGSSEKAHNRGVPGSPRDGAAVEITGLLYSTLRWVDSLASVGKWPAKGVTAIIGGKKTVVSYKEWAELVRGAFEKCYYIPLDAEDDKDYRVDPGLVNRRGIYKDVFGSGKGREWSDYQLRSNFAMAMCVAPELFDARHAVTALQAADAVLRDVLGMKTLDPGDRNYRPVYDNSNDTDDFHMAKGWSYHNGPPWVFPYGFFARAYHHFDVLAGAGRSLGADETRHRLSRLFSAHRAHVGRSPWAGLPELTNAEGRECADSCPTQAWSASCVLDALEELGKSPQPSSARRRKLETKA